jgi:phospholipase/lecithinase/hemolysin
MIIPQRSRQFILGVFFAVAVAAPHGADPWKSLYVFGDSYSDSGAGYVDINGPTAVVYLARTLGIPFTHANDPERGNKGLNFAVSGAQTGAGEGRKVKDSLLGRGMKNQVAEFVQRVEAGEITFDPARTLFFIAGGLNDRRLPTETTVANLEEHIRALYGKGARHFFVALLPTKIRSFAAVGERLNPALTLIPEQLKLDGATIRLSHWGEYFDAVMENPARHGITNTTDACAGRALFDQDVTPKGDPETYFFYHEGHPSTAVHRIVAEGLVREARAAEPAATAK